LKYQTAITNNLEPQLYATFLKPKINRHISHRQKTDQKRGNPKRAIIIIIHCASAHFLPALSFSLRAVFSCISMRETCTSHKKNLPVSLDLRLLFFVVAYWTFFAV
jgi:hypothetical protein